MRPLARGLICRRPRRSHCVLIPVVPAKAGIQLYQEHRCLLRELKESLSLRLCPLLKSKYWVFPCSSEGEESFSCTPER